MMRSYMPKEFSKNKKYEEYKNTMNIEFAEDSRLFLVPVSRV